MSYILIYKDRSGGSILLARFAAYWLHFTCVFPPLGAALSDSVFTWTPSAEQTGEYTVRFVVQDLKGGSTTEAV